MATTLTNKIVKIRKQRICFCCYRKFEKDTEMKYWSCVIDGGFNSGYNCITCDNILDIHHKKYQESEFEEGYVSECLDKGETPEQYLERITK